MKMTKQELLDIQERFKADVEKHRQILIGLDSWLFRCKHGTTLERLELPRAEKAIRWAKANLAGVQKRLDFITEEINSLN